MLFNYWRWVASVRLYGITSYAVASRTSEIGLLALGADRSNVVRMVLRGAFLQVGIGLVRIPIALIGGHYIADQLYGVRAYDR